MPDGHPAGEALGNIGDPVEHPGLGGCWFDDDDLHAKRLDLPTQCVADRFDRELRPGVGPYVAVPTFPPIDEV